jgi:hypothetical protein
MDDDDDVGFGGCGPSGYLFHSGSLPPDVHITPSYLGNRLFSMSPVEHYVASGGGVCCLKISLDSTLGFEESSAPTIPFQSMSTISIASLKHRSLISSLTLSSKDGKCLATADESGEIQLSFAGESQPFSEWRSETISPRSSDGESGWCGVEFDGKSSNHVYAAKGFQRALSLFDITTKSLVRTVYCTHNPTSLTVTDDGLAVMAEHNQVSIWDLRASERKG